MSIIARGARRSLRPSMTPAVYVNFMGGDEDDRVPEAYQQRWERLVAIKSHYDPDNLFRLNQNIRPQKRSLLGRAPNGTYCSLRFRTVSARLA